MIKGKEGLVAYLSKVKKTDMKKLKKRRKSQRETILK